jgi:oligopeptide/dipeptide ABC transporter ATP-binding protein
MTKATPPIVSLENIRKDFRLGGGLIGRIFGSSLHVTALDDVSLVLNEGEVFGLVGESGSGKSTLAHVLVRLIDSTSGIIRYRGKDITNATPHELRPFRRRMQLVFQDSQSSFNPRKTIGRVLWDALRLSGLESNRRHDRGVELLSRVGLTAQVLSRYPHELSGGQRQRIAIGRALAMQPEVLVADEPVSSLDVSLQAQILNLLMRLRQQLGLTMMFISHDLAVVNAVSSRVGVMYAGRLLEIGRPAEVLQASAHPYTQALLASIPSGLARQSKEASVSGEPPNLGQWQSGCRFAARCPHAMPVCSKVFPARTRLSATHEVECHLHGVDSDHPRAPSASVNP